MIRPGENNNSRQDKRDKPRRYDTGKETIDNFGKAQVGKPVTITLRSGRIESGILRGFGQYDIALEVQNGHILIIMKHAIDIVGVL
ncbi:hypothetical protein Thermo_00103 [Thermoplasmatales archaeon]|nr:hypothetical protein Thermo_00103 [Thermoplasmatales archaeon]